MARVARQARARWGLLLFGIVLSAAAWGLPQNAAADPRATISVKVIHAKLGPPYLHEELKPLWDTLKKTFGERFAFFDLLDKREGTVDVEGAVRLTMPDGDTFAAIYGGVTPDKGLVRVSVEYGEFRTKVRIHSGGMFFQAGKQFRAGTIVVAIKATIEKN
jgi:hypothetical protein